MLWVLLCLAGLDLDVISKNWTQLRKVWFILSDSHLHYKSRALKSQTCRMFSPFEISCHSGVLYLDIYIYYSMLYRLYTKNCMLYNHILLAELEDRSLSVGREKWDDSRRTEENWVCDKWEVKRQLQPITQAWSPKVFAPRQRIQQRRQRSWRPLTGRKWDHPGTVWLLREQATAVWRQRHTCVDTHAHRFIITRIHMRIQCR